MSGHGRRRTRPSPVSWLVPAFACLAVLTLPDAAWAQAAPAPPPAGGLPSLDQLLPPGSGAVSGRMVQLFAAITVLSIAPGLLIMVTCFTRFAIALSFLRSGIGLQTTPANMVLVSLALFLTMFVMAPVFDQAWTRGLSPLMENKISEREAYTEVTAPFRKFMRANVRDKDLRIFSDMLPGADGAKPTIDPETDLRILVPAFMLSEIRRGFEIGFLVILPFLVIDLIVATITMAMGMMMMPPTVIALPFKILFFILIDGWNLIAGSLIRSYAG